MRHIGSCGSTLLYIHIYSSDSETAAQADLSTLFEDYGQTPGHAVGGSFVTGRSRR
jgi:hypothetical protein